MKRIKRYQCDEITGSILYEKIGSRQKDENNRKLLLELAAVEKQHALVWKNYSQVDVGSNWMKIFVYLFLYKIFGFTFAIKLMEKNEALTLEDYAQAQETFPEVGAIMKDEEEHEERLLGLMDEDRLKYVGAMVLGLNDALVELTGIWPA